MKTKFFYSVIVMVAMIMAGFIGQTEAQTSTLNKKYVSIINKDGKPAEKTLFRAEGSRLFNVKQFQYSYDTQDRITRIDVNFWNEQSECWELRYTATYSYQDGKFEQQFHEFNIGTLQYEIIADKSKIEEIFAL